MRPDEAEKLLGGYATGTLSDQERQALFEAALASQALFDALADEQALKELLDDPASRAQLLAALEERRQGLFQRMTGWMRRPAAIALAGAMAAGVLIVAMVWQTPRMAKQAPVMTATAPPPQAVAPPAMDLERQERRAAGPPAQVRKDARIAKPEAPAARRENPADANAPQPRAAPPVLPAPPAAAESVGVVGGVAPAMPAALPPPPAPSASPVLAFREEAGKAPTARDLYYAQRAQMLDALASPRRKMVARSNISGYAGAPAAAARNAPAAALRTPGVRYSVLKLGVDGAYGEVDPATVFRPGDDVRLRFETNQEGDLAVLERDASGNWNLRLAARTHEGQPVYMPAESSLTLRQPGEMRLFVMFSRGQPPPARLRDAAATPNLMYEKADRSTYVVNPAGSPDAPVAFEIRLGWK